MFFSRKAVYVDKKSMEDDMVPMGWWQKEMQVLMACPIKAGCNPSGERTTTGNNRQQ